MVSKLNAPAKAGVAKPTIGSIYADIGFGGLWGGLGTRIVRSLFLSFYRQSLMYNVGVDHDRYPHLSPMDSLRFVQGRHGSPYHRIRRSRGQVFLIDLCSLVTIHQKSSTLIRFLIPPLYDLLHLALSPTLTSLGCYSVYISISSSTVPHVEFSEILDSLSVALFAFETLESREKIQRRQG